MINRDLIPEQWEIKKISEIGKVKGGKRLPKGASYAETKTPFPYLRVVDFENQSINHSQLRYLTPEVQQTIRNYTISKNDVFISIAGTIGVTGVIPENLDGANLTENAAKITDLKGVYNKYLSLYLSSICGQSQIKNHTISTTQPKLSLFRIDQIVLPLPHIDKQKEIVFRIEELFSEFDKSIEALKTAQQQLKVYRQSVLKWAFEGRLLKKNSQNVSLPPCWSITQIGKISPRVTVGHVGPMKNEYVDQGVPFLRGQNVRANRFDSNGLKFISKEFHQKLSKSTIVPGDILVVRSGNVGTSCVVPDTLKEANCSDLVIVKRPNNVNSHWVAYYLNSVVESKVAAQKVGVALVHFNTKTVEKFSIPIPPIDEQEDVLKEIESRLSVADKVEETIVNSLEQAEALRQSILKKAFEGKLI